MVTVLQQAELLCRDWAAFYRKSTEILLEQWHQERNQFQGRDKKLILQHHWIAVPEVVQLLACRV